MLLWTFLSLGVHIVSVPFWHNLVYLIRPNCFPKWVCYWKWDFLLLHILTNTLIILVGEKTRFFVVIICTFLITKEAEYHFMFIGLLDILFCKMPIQVSCLFLKMILECSLDILNEFLVDFCSNIFSHSDLAFFYSLNGVFFFFEKWKLSILM